MNKGSRGSAAFFWILWVLIGGVSIILELSAANVASGLIKGYAGLIATVVVLILMIALRKKLYKSVIGHLFTWILAIVALTVVFAFGLSINGNKDIANIQFSISKSLQFSNGAARITNEGFARTVDPTTFEPIEKTNVFKPEDKMIYFVVMLDYIQGGVVINSVWYYEGEAVVNSDPVTINQELKGRYFAASLPQPQTQYPVGKYDVELIGTKDGKTIFSIKDSFEVK